MSSTISTAGGLSLFRACLGGSRWAGRAVGWAVGGMTENSIEYLCCCVAGRKVQKLIEAKL